MTDPIDAETFAAWKTSQDALLQEARGEAIKMAKILAEILICAGLLPNDPTVTVSTGQLAIIGKIYALQLKVTPDKEKLN